MDILSAIAGVMIVVGAVGLLAKYVFGIKGAISLAGGKVTIGESAQVTICSALLVLGGVVLFRQVNAAAGQGSSAADPWLLNAINDKMKEISQGASTLPKLK